MKKIVIHSLLFICLFSFTNDLYAQQRTITGVVTTLKNVALVNAEVKVLSSKVTVFTDTLGQFKVSCLIKDKISFKAKGFTSKKVKIDEETKKVLANLDLKPGKKSIDVALGFGHINETDKSYAITSVRNESKYEFSKYTNIIDAIVDSSPSVSYAGSGILIRGESSLIGSSYALVVVDGIGVNMSQLSALSTSDVKSIDILKGGAAAIYGSRGANGVVIITTKRGNDN